MTTQAEKMCSYIAAAGHKFMQEHYAFMEKNGINERDAFGYFIESISMQLTHVVSLHDLDDALTAKFFEDLKNELISTTCSLRKQRSAKILYLDSRRHFNHANTNTPHALNR